MIAIIDYKAGNLTSVKLAFEHLGVKAEITDLPEKISRAERAVFPGVGSAGAAMENIKRMKLDRVIAEVVGSGKPFLGICLGTQIIFDSSEEDGGTAGLGLISGTVRRFTPEKKSDKVPQIGWNTVDFCRPHPVLEGIESGSEFYFVHSYYALPAMKDEIVGETGYAGATFASIVGKNNLIATQFHPEKSGGIGLRLLQNFSRWNP